MNWIEIIIIVMIFFLIIDGLFYKKDIKLDLDLITNRLERYKNIAIDQRITYMSEHAELEKRIIDLETRINDYELSNIEVVVPKEKKAKKNVE